MFTDKQLAPPSKAQLSYIESLERKTGLTFYGTSTREAIKFIEKAKQSLEESKITKRKIERENEKFPFPDLKNALPSQKQWQYIQSLEEKTMIKFTGVTKMDAMEYIDMMVSLIKEESKTPLHTS